MSRDRAPAEAPAVPPDESPARTRKVGRRFLFALLVVAAVVVTAVGVVVATAPDASPPSLDSAQVGAIVDKAIGDLKSEPATSAVVYQQILPSIVSIEARGRASNGSDSGFGAGVIVNRNGSILTAHHVVAGAESLRVSFVDGTRSEAIVVSSDPENDIAVLQAVKSPEVIVPAVLGGAGQVGEEAYAVGHPLGYVGSLTSGVISGLDRTVTIGDGTTLRGLIQFDTAVNPGNSGGPLLNRAGQVIGIVTALADATREGFFVGVGFAVPIGTAGGAANAPPK